MLESLINLDKELFLFLNGFNNSFFDIIMYWISHRFFWVPFYILIFFILSKKIGWNVFVILLFTIILITLTDQISVFMKSYFGRFRPTHDPDLNYLVHTVRGYVGGNFGFVSSHAANVFGFAVFLGKILNRYFKFIYTILIIWALFVSYSRIYLGVHFPGDIICGGLLGSILGIIFYYIFILTAPIFRIKL